MDPCVACKAKHIGLLAFNTPIKTYLVLLVVSWCLIASPGGDMRRAADLFSPCSNSSFDNEIPSYKGLGI